MAERAAEALVRAEAGQVPFGEVDQPDRLALAAEPGGWWRFADGREPTGGDLASLFVRAVAALAEQPTIPCSVPRTRTPVITIVATAH
jgi:hypothetical protein